MGVRAKVYLHTITTSQYGSSVELRVVTRGEDNKAWSQATPTGEIKLGIKNELALDYFRDQLGREFYVDIELVPEAAQGQEGMGG